MCCRADCRLGRELREEDTILCCGERLRVDGSGHSVTVLTECAVLQLTLFEFVSALPD